MRKLVYSPATREKLDPDGRADGSTSGIYTGWSIASRVGTLEKL